MLLAFGGSPAHAATATSVTMFSEPGDYIGGGQQRLFHPGNATVTVSGSTSSLTVSVSGGTHGDSYALQFAAPIGQTLTTGVYTGAQRAAFRESGRPGMDIFGSGRGCNEVGGHFEVKDIATSPGGGIARLWIVYEQHCEDGAPALFGEVRYAVAAPDGAAEPAPSLVRWPGLDVGRPGTVVPVTVLAASAAQPVSAALLGTNPGDFSIRSDECSGVSLSAGASCQIWLRYMPTAEGERAATLRIAYAGGATDDVALSGYGYGGSTRVFMESEPGDFVGDGATWSYTPADAVILASGTRSHVTFRVDGANGDWWFADFAAAPGDILTPGTYKNATRWPFNGSGPGLDVSGEGRGCNTLTGEFTVTHATFGPDGRVRTFGASFVQHCEGEAPALRGVYEFRAGAGMTPPPPPPPPPPPIVPPPPPAPIGGAPSENGSLPLDTSAPRAHLSGARLQRLGRSLVVRVACADERCLATGRATIRILRPGAPTRTLRLAAVRRTIGRGTRATLTLRLPERTRARIRRALRSDGTRVFARLAVTVADGLGNARTMRRDVRIIR